MDTQKSTDTAANEGETDMVRVLVCSQCGSDDVACDALATWNPNRGRFELSDVSEHLQQSIYCPSCDSREVTGDWVARPRTEPLWGCPECGCTDVQDQAWVDVNGDQIHDSSERYMWCPQCDLEGRAGEIYRLAEVMTLKPLRTSEEAIASA